MSESDKEGILQEIEDYLQPRTTKWYAQQGLAKRRGYLFHGPPGTAKSTFALALAGHFSLDLYYASLGDLNLTNTDLTSMFRELPQQCILLLEDVDASGIGISRTEEATNNAQ